MEIWNKRQNALALIVFALLGMVPVQYTYFLAIRYSNAATATVLQYLCPVLVVLYMSTRKRTWPSPVEIIALLLAVLGTFLLVTHGDPGSLSISTAGLLMGLASAIALAFYTLQPARLLSDFSSVIVVGWGMLLGGLAFSFYRSFLPVPGSWDMETLGAMAFLVLFGTLFAFYAYLTAVKLIGGQKASLLASAEPLSATLVAVWWLQVPFQFFDWLGSFAIVSTIFIIGARSGKSKGNR